MVWIVQPGTRNYNPAPVTVSNVSNAIAVAAGGQHSLALLSDGTVCAWGYNLYGQLGDGTTTYDRTTAVAVSGLANVVEISAGGDHSLALLSDGTVALGVRTSTASWATAQP